MSNIVNETDVLVRIIESSEEDIRKEQEQEAWEKVYQARQNRSIMIAELRGVETHAGTLCGVVFVGHIKGIIPLEQSGYEQRYQLEDAAGQNVYFKILQLDREGETFVASRTAAIEHLQGLSWDMLRKDQVVEATVIKINKRSVRLDIGAIETVLPVEEVSYEWISDLHERFKVGDTVKVKITEADKETKTLAVSAKALQKNPWPDCARRFQKGNQYTGRVSGVVEYGVFVNLEAGVDVLCRQPAPTVGKVKPNQKVKVKIKNVDVENERITGDIKSNLK